MIYEDDLVDSHQLRYDFWETSRWSDRNFNKNDVITYVMLLNDIKNYVGPKILHPKIAFSLQLDVKIASYMNFLPHKDKIMYRVWIGCARDKFLSRKDCWPKEWEESLGKKIQEISL